MRAACILTVLGLAPFGALAEPISGSDFAFGNWQGAAYTYDDTGSFSHCGVSAQFVSGDTLIFSVNDDASVSVAVISPGLALQPGQTLPVTLYVDRRRPMQGTAEAIDESFAVLRIDDFDLAMTSFMKGRMLTVETPAGTGTYDLTGTFGALEGARNCAIRYYDYAGLPAETPPVQPVVESATAASPADRTVLFQIATEMIAEIGVSDFRYLDASETAALIDGDAVFWSADAEGIFGGVMTLPKGEAESLRATDAGDIGFLGDSCEGELATTTRAVSVPDSEAREIRALCVTDAGQTESLLTKVLIGDQVLYTLLVFDGSGAAATAPNDRRALSEDVAIRAASFIRDNAPAE